MIRQNWKYLSVLALVSVLFLYTEMNKPLPTDWRPTFHPNRKSPYGLWVLNNMWHRAFPNHKVEETDQSVYNFLKTLNDRKVSQTNFVLINHIFSFDKETADELLQYVANGNHVLISTNEMPRSLSDTLKIGISNFWGTTLEDGLDPNKQEKQDSVQVVLLDRATFGDTVYPYPTYLANQDILIKETKLRSDSTRLVRLGKSKMWTNFVQMRYGKGAFLIHAMPFAFTNYVMLEGKNADYAFKVLSYLPVQKTYFEAYLRGMNEETSLLRFVMRQDALRWAYWLLMLGGALFIFTFAKRRQRVIPVIHSPENSSLSFIRTVGRLYFQQGDHRNLAEKKIQYFLAQIRHQYHLPTQLLDDEFRTRFAQKSGKPQAEVEALFDYIAEMQSKKSITENELNKLGMLIQKIM